MDLLCKSPMNRTHMQAISRNTVQHRGAQLDSQPSVCVSINQLQQVKRLTDVASCNVHQDRDQEESRYALFCYVCAAVSARHCMPQARVDITSHGCTFYMVQ
eukprot:m.363012 g.363012  ORF g.363012 m.363012 type:complete len:102 (-) comp21316_c0_seq1:208-513(-)